MSVGLRIGSANWTTRLLLRWYLSGDWDYLVILDLIISPLPLSAPRELVEVAGMVGEGAFWKRLSVLYSIVCASLLVFGTSEPLSLFLAWEEPTSIVSALGGFY